MKKAFILVIILMTFPSAEQISPAVAANLKFAFEEIRHKFTEKTGYIVSPIYASSGKLVSQIRNGAPFDIFVCSNIGFADSVCVWKLNANKPKIYAYGKLILWTLKPYDLTKGVGILADKSVKTIAIGDLLLTVYGPAAKAYLETENLWSKVQSKIVIGENITKIAQFIVSGSADIGFNAKSIVLSEEMKGKGTWVEIDSTKYDPLPQAALVLKYGEQNNSIASYALYDFLHEKEAKEILIRYGFRVPD